MEALVEEVLTRARFYRLGNPEVIRGMVKHLLRRMDPDTREMRVMLGMFGKINRALQGIVPVAGVRKERKKGALQTPGTSVRKNAAGS